MRKRLIAATAGVFSLSLAFAPALFASWPHQAKRIEQQLRSDAVSERLTALQELAGLSPSLARTPLLTALQDSEPSVQKGAAQLAELFALSGFSSWVADWFSSRDAEKRLLAVALTWRDPSADNQKLLASVLRDSERSVREAAARALGRQPRPLPAVAQQELLTALDDSEARVRLQAAIALGRVGEPDSALSLAAHLQDAEWSVRVQLALALGLLDNPAVVPSLLLSLSDSQPEVRAAAAESLGRLGQPEALPGLLALLNASPFSEPQKRAAEALARIGAPQAIDALVGQLGRDEARIYVLRILETVGISQSAALDACLEVAVESELAACLKLHEQQGEGSTAARVALDEGRISPELAFRYSGLQRETLLVPALETIDSQEGQPRDWAISFLEKKVPLPATAARPLMDALQSAGESAESTQRVLELLALTLPGAAPEPLLSYLDSTFPAVRKAAAHALVGQGLSGEALEALLLERRVEIAQEAFRALGARQSLAQAEVVLKLLARGDTGRRAHLLRALGALPPGIDDSQLEAVEQEIYWSREGERDQLLLAFARNGSAARLLRIAEKGNRADRLRLAQLSLYHPQGLEVARGLVRYDEPRVQALALQTLGRGGSERAVQDILPFIENLDATPLYLQASGYQALTQLVQRGVPVSDTVSLEPCSSKYWPLQLRTLAFALSQGRACPHIRAEDLLLLSEDSRLRMGAARLLSSKPEARASLARCATYETNADIARLCRNGIPDRGEASEGELPFAQVEFFTPWSDKPAPLTPAPVEFENDVLVLFSDRQGQLLLPWGARTSADPAWAY